MGIDFLNLAEIKYESETMTPAAFYPKVKSHITANTARAGQVIQHNNNQQQAANETVGPCFQDYILYNTIKEIDPHLIKHIQSHYKLKIADGQRLTDLKSDIFSNIPKFVEEIQQQESLNALRAQSSNLASFQQPTAPQQVQGVEQLLPHQVTAQGVDALSPGASSLPTIHSS